MTKAPPIRQGVRWLYGFGSVAYGVKDNGFSYFLMFYYNQARPAGIACGHRDPDRHDPDAVSDPLVGYWSDNTHSRLGRRHPFMYASAIPVAFAYFFIWNPPVEHLSEFGLFL